VADIMNYEEAIKFGGTSTVSPTAVLTEEEEEKIVPKTMTYEEAMGFGGTSTVPPVVSEPPVVPVPVPPVVSEPVPPTEPVLKVVPPIPTEEEINKNINQVRAVEDFILTSDMSNLGVNPNQALGIDKPLSYEGDMLLDPESEYNKYMDTQVTPPQKPKYTMNDLTDIEKDVGKQWAKNAKIIYDYDKNKASESWGADNVNFREKDKDESYAEWFKDRQSRLYDFTNLGSTAYNAITDMPDNVKKAWVETLKTYDDTDGDAAAFGRALRYTVTDPSFWGTFLVTGGIVPFLRTLGGKTAQAVGKLAFSTALQDGLVGKIGKEAAKDLVQSKVVGDNLKKEVVKEALETTSKEAAKTVTKTRIAVGAASAGGWTGLADFLKQNLEIGVGVIDEAKQQEFITNKAADFEKEYLLANPTATQQDIKNSFIMTVGKELENLEKSGEFTKKDLDYFRLATSTLVGSALGAGLGGALSKVGNKKLLTKINKAIDSDSPVIQKKKGINLLPTRVNEDGSIDYVSLGIGRRSKPKDVQDEINNVAKQLNEGEEGSLLLDEAISNKLKKTIDRSAANNGLELIEDVIEDGIAGFKIRKIKAVDEVLDNGDTIIKSSVTREIDEVGQPKINFVNKVTEVIGKYNTKLGRIMTTRGSLPSEEVADAAKELAQINKGGVGLEIVTEIKALKKLAQGKRYNGKIWRTDINAPKFTDEEINLLLNRSEQTNLQGLPEVLQNQVNKIIKKIDDNESFLNAGLGLKGNDRLGIGIRGNGEVYFTRSFEAALDPNYSEGILKVLKTGKGRKKFIDKVYRAKEYFINKKGFTEPEAKKQLELIIRRLSDPDAETFLSSVTSGSSSNQKVLSKRQVLDTEILDFLGEIKDPYKKIKKTLENQERLLAHINYVKTIEDFLSDNMGKRVDLGGFFHWKWFPKAKTTISPGKKNPDGKITGQVFGENANLKEIDKVFGNRFGGTFDILPDIFVSEQFQRYIADGIDVFVSKGKQESNFFSKLYNNFKGVSSFTQAGQTIFDQGAYLMNTIGAFSALLKNGYLFSPKIIKQGPKAFKILLSQATRNSGSNAKFLDKMKKERLIDSDTTGAMLTENAKLIMEGSSNRTTRFLSSIYKVGTEVLSKAYGAADALSKVVGQLSEMDALYSFRPRRTANGKFTETKEAYDDRIFKEAADRVRQVIPSYTEAVPIARAASKVPLVGNYILFPTEVVRTNKGTITVARKDMAEGIKDLNIKQFYYGFKRLASQIAIWSAWTAGLTVSNNKQNVNEKSNRGIDIITPTWGGRKIFMEQVDPKKKDKKGKPVYHKGAKQFKDLGPITIRYMNSSTLDADNYVRDPIEKASKIIMAKAGLIEREEIELDFALKSAVKNVVTSYTNPRMLTGEIASIVMEVDTKTGRPIYLDAAGEKTGDRIKIAGERLIKAMTPGFFKDYLFRMWQVADSEELLGLGQGVLNTGQRVSMDDMEAYQMSGSKPTTLVLDKAIGYSLSQDVKAIDKLRNEFINYIRKLPVSKEDKTPLLLDKFIEVTNRKREAVKKLSSKIGLVKDIQYTNSNGELVKIGIPEILKMASNDFYYKVNPTIKASTILGKLTDKTFVPDQLIKDKEVKRLLKEKGITIEPEDYANLLEKFYEVWLTELEKGK
tara:strand:+ start:1618 stop:6525 length:4908 start_codon:yes stop_codon:yes gene_type:complete